MVMKKITKEMNLHQALKENPNAAQVFASYHMGCASCSGGQQETVEWGAMMHGVVVDEILSRLNEGETSAKKKKAGKD